MEFLTVLPIVNGFTIALQRLTESAVKAVGFDNFAFSSGSSSPMGDLLSDIYDTEDGLTEISDSAKKLNKQLRSFDELNVINSSDNSNDSLAGISGMAGGLLDSALNEAIENYNQRWNEAFSGIENRAETFANNFLAKMEPIKQLGRNILAGDWFAVGANLSGIGSSIFNSLTDSLAKVDWSEVGSNIGGFLAGVDWAGVASSAGRLFWEGINSAIKTWKSSFDAAPIETTIITAIAGLSFTGLGAAILTGIATALSPKALVAGLSSVFSSLTGSTLFANIGEMFALWTGGAGTLGESFMAVFGVPGAVVAGLAGLAVGLATVFAKNEEVRNSFKEATNAIKEGLQPAIQFFTETLLPDLSSGWSRIQEVLSPFTEFLNNTFVSIWQDMINPALTYIGTTVLPMVTGAFANLWNNVLVPAGSVLMDVLAPAVQYVSDVFGYLWQGVVVPLAGAVGNILGKAFEGLVGVFNIAIEKVSGIVNMFKFLWDEGIKPIIDSLWNKLKPAYEKVFGSISQIIGGVGDVLGGFVDFVTGIFTLDLEKAWSGVEAIFSGFAETISGIFDGLFEGIWEGIRSIGDALSELFVGEKGAFVGGAASVTINHGKRAIPAQTYATGGFPEDGLFYANHTELVGQFSNGRTAVANNQQITQGIADAVYPAVYNAVVSAMANSNRNSGDTVVNIDGREVFRAVTKEWILESKRTSKNPVPIYG